MNRMSRQISVPAPAILCIAVLVILITAAAISALTRAVRPFENLREDNVAEAAYLTVHTGYQPLPAEDRQRLIEALRAIQVSPIGSEWAASPDGGVSTQFRITLTDGTQYIVASVFPCLAIDGLGYARIGEESEALLQEIRDIFYGQSDHMVPW